MLFSKIFRLSVPSSPWPWRLLRMLMMWWADSRHICIRFCTLREVLRVSRKHSGDSKRILRKQKRRGLVARMMHWTIPSVSRFSSSYRPELAFTWWYWRCKYADNRDTPLDGSKCNGNDWRSSSASPAMFASADFVLRRNVRLIRPSMT